MRFIYDNYIDDTDYTLSADSEYNSNYEIENIQDQRLGKKWKNASLTSIITNSDCESTNSPTLDGSPSGVTNATWARDAGQKQAGTYSWSLNKDSAAAGGDAYIYLVDSYSSTDDLHGLSAGFTYEINLYLYSDVASVSNAKIIFEEYYSAAWHEAESYSPIQANTWENHTSIITLNSAATGFRPKIFIASAEAQNKKLHIDEIYFYLQPRIFLDAGSGNTLNPTCCCILGHNLSTSAVVKIQGNASLDWSSPTVDETITYSAGNMLKYFTGSALRYWSISFNDYDNSDGYIEIGRAYISTYLTVTKSAKYGFPINFGTTSENYQNPSGSLFGIKGINLKEYKLTFSYWTPSMLDSILAMWDVVGTFKPWILDCNELNSTIFPPLYCYFKTAPKVDYAFKDVFEGNIDIKEAK